MTQDFTDASHWDAREGKARARLPSQLNVSVRDITKLLSRHFKAGNRVFEAGCAPGKYLLWCAVAGEADVAGVEYAEKSYRDTKDLFRAMGTDIDLRHEDFFNNTFQPASFDMVYSFGLIEHFEGDRLREIIRKHVELLKPAGTAVIIIPNYRGWYGSVLARIDRANLETHNLDVMSAPALEQLNPEGTKAVAYPYGMLTPWILFYGVPSNPFGKLLMYGLNVIGLLQPFKINALCPWLVLEITKN